MKEFLVTCQHPATAFGLPFYNIFAPSKNSSFEVSDDVIASDLCFGPPQSKILATPMVFDLTGPRFEPQTYRSKDERDTARSTSRSKDKQGIIWHSFVSRAGLFASGSGLRLTKCRS